MVRLLSGVLSSTGLRWNHGNKGTTTNLQRPRRSQPTIGHAKQWLVNDAMGWRANGHLQPQQPNNTPARLCTE